MAAAGARPRRLARPILVLVTGLAALLLTGSARAVELGTVPDITWGTSRADIDRTVALMQDAGVRWVRANISWNGIERDGKGVFNLGYLADVDYAIDRARAAGINVLLPISDGVPYWASADPAKADGKWNPYWRPTNFEDYADFVRFTVERYKSKGVHAYEIWNEPNHAWFWPSGVNPAEYVEMLRAGYQAVKGVDPSATVVLGGLSKSDYRFLQGVYDAGGGAYFDAVGVHPYTGIVDPTLCWGTPYSMDAFCAIEEVRKTMVANGDSGKRLWLTELGWTTGTSAWSVSETQQADFLDKAIKKLEGYSYVGPAFYYGFRNVYWLNDSAPDLQANFGLLKTNFSPKPAFDVFKAHALGTTSIASSEPSSEPATRVADLPPTVDLTSPREGAVVGSRLVIAATATDDNAVVKVEFRIDGKLVATDMRAPYSYTWKVPTKLASGSHVITAAAYDATGASVLDSVTVQKPRPKRR